jgi:hypothetical protein
VVSLIWIRQILYESLCSIFKNWTHQLVKGELKVAHRLCTITIARMRLEDDKALAVVRVEVKQINRGEWNHEGDNGWGFGARF